MAQYITKYNAPPAADRWDTVTRDAIASRLAQMKDWLSRSKDELTINSLNSELEDAEAALDAADNGDKVWFAEDEDGGYYAVGERWQDFDESDIYDYEMGWFDENSGLDLPPADEPLDEAIAASLDRRGLRRLNAAGVFFDSLANSEEWKEAVHAGCDAWAAERGLTADSGK